MALSEKEIAKKQILQTFRIGNIFMRVNGISFIGNPPETFWGKLKVYVTFSISILLVIYMVVGQISYTASLLVGSVSVDELLRGYVHVAGYGVISFGKLIMVRYQNHAFRRLISELPDIWPGSGVDTASAEIKRSSLQALRIMQIFYTCWNVFGVLMFTVTPIALYVYKAIRGEPAQVGYIYHLYYPFDQTKPVNHVIVFCCEMCGGFSSVCAMLSADILFITMASHISMLLRILQVKIRRIGAPQQEDQGCQSPQDDYAMIVDVINIHQRLISYANDIENAFTVVNLINVLLSSINICCVVFSVVFLDPLFEMSNKLFTGAALTQMGVVCWYADDIFRASAGVSDAVYESGWYRCNPRSRRALLVMLQRSQRPLYFTALKFRPITMMTYSSILTTAYSYFTLLYTSYSE
uniref:Odorant receptor n=1 Tax=Glyphodes pyloalis TaxID=1242752 RepID=A0A6M3GXT8_GLYPY|nr:olfactory receptor [Glyphodes pyloalis]